MANVDSAIKNVFPSEVKMNDEFKRRYAGFKELKKVHNILKSDFTTLYHLSKKEDDISIIRASCKELFSLIEADLFLLNNIFPYEEYNDRHNFQCKFKKTYKNICQEYDLMNLYIDFSSKHIGQLWELAQVRNDITHPKAIASIDISRSILPKLESSFNSYDSFFNDCVRQF